MVVIRFGCIAPHPAVRALGAPDELGFLNDIRAHPGSSLFDLCRARDRLDGEMLVEEIKYLVPAVKRLLRAIGHTGGVEEGMAGTVIAMELVALAQLLEYGLGAVD